MKLIIQPYLKETPEGTELRCPRRTGNVTVPVPVVKRMFNTGLAISEVDIQITSSDILPIIHPLYQI